MIHILFIIENLKYFKIDFKIEILCSKNKIWGPRQFKSLWFTEFLFFFFFFVEKFGCQIVCLDYLSRKQYKLVPFGLVHSGMWWLIWFFIKTCHYTFSFGLVTDTWLNDGNFCRKVMFKLTWIFARRFRILSL